MMMIFKSASAVGDEKLGKELGDSDDENIDPDPESESLSNQPMSTKLRKSTRENVAKIYGLTTVSPRMIAYSAVAVRHTLFFYVYLFLIRSMLCRFDSLFRACLPGEQTVVFLTSHFTMQSSTSLRMPSLGQMKTSETRNYWHGGIRE